VTEILARQIIEAQGYSVLLRGHGAELAKTSLAWPLHTDATIFNMQRKEEFIPCMLKRVNYISPRLSWRELFTDRWATDMQEAARCFLESSLAHLSLAPPDLCSYLYLMEHHRRFTVPSLELFRDIVEVRLPFVDVEFLRALWNGPAKWRDGTEIHRAIIARNHPELLSVRNSNTGAPAGAGPLVEFVLDKINSLFKRLNIYGFRHYHNYEKWMRHQLNTAVENVLLQPDSLARGIYREKALRHLLDETRQGRGDYGYLFQVLLILELWQQEHT
jgi:asparagine synthase (glutamine-hydrolysing)